MKHRFSLIALALVAGLATTSDGFAQARSEQGELRRDQRAGHALSLREIESRVLPAMRGKQYLGPEYDSTAMTYRLKFIEGGRVVFVDVDARTGQVIRRMR